MTDLLPAIFISCAIVGLGVLVFALIFDGLLDFVDGPFGVETIASVVGVFGLVGFILTLVNDTLSLVAVLITSIVSGLLSGVLIAALVRFLHRSEGEGVPMEGFVGLTGTMLQRVSPETVGRVQVIHRGMPHIFDATSDQEIAEGTTVKISEDLGSLQVRVIDASSPYHSISGSPANP